MVCSIPGCGRDVHAAELCRSHYAKRNGPDARAPIRSKRDAHTTTKVLNLTMSKGTAKKIRREAMNTKTSEHAVIVGVLEKWAAKRKR